jgi:LacI family transcriptional regulator
MFVGLEANFVGVDDHQAGLLATEHLIERGYKRIAHIRGPRVSTAAGRLEGYRNALARHALAMPPRYVVAEKSGDEAGDTNGYKAMRRLLRLDPRPDAVFCYNDPTGMGAMKAILEAGLRIPADVAIIGCGNVRYSELLRVPLSTIDQNSSAIGARAATLALKLVESSGRARPKTILLKPKLVVRASTG